MAYVKTTTLVAATVYTYEPGVNVSFCEVTNMDGASEVYFTTTGVAPTVGGDNCIAMPAAIGSVEVKEEIAGNASIKLISAGTPKVSVRVW